jgi:hypothetical protein
MAKAMKKGRGDIVRWFVETLDLLYETEDREGLASLLKRAVEHGRGEIVHRLYELGVRPTDPKLADLDPDDYAQSIEQGKSGNADLQGSTTRESS